MTRPPPITRPKPLVLCILDGWGERSGGADNAIHGGHTPVWDRLVAAGPRSSLETSGRAVGLPAGQMGNSEVGHMNLGAGRVVAQDLPRIDAAIADGALPAALAGFAGKIRATGGKVHLSGLLSPGGVHAHQDHMLALARSLTGHGLAVAIHGFLDGRDTPPRSAGGFLADFEAALATIPGATMASLAGRYYAMDRDRRWDRVHLAWQALVAGEAPAADSAAAAIAASYAAGIGDEFLKPVCLGGHAGMADGDGLLMANFRADRARQILSALLDPDFDGFARHRRPRFAAALGMVSYGEALDPLLPALFPPQRLDNTLGAVLADAGLRQLRIAETEKYAHITFFFNGGAEKTFPGEQRILVPSPRVATYDLQPEMSAPEVTDRLIDALPQCDVAVVNYANGDMVGHTGNYDAAVRAVEAVDVCLGRLGDAVTAAGGVLLITADHGNCEQMTDPHTGHAHTAHTVGPVPLVGVGLAGLTLESGRLCDVAPTILALLGLPQPAEMTGRSLLGGRKEAP